MKFGTRKKFSRKDSILLLERLELYLSAGLVIDRALTIIESDMTGSLKQSIITMRNKIESGHSIAEGLSDSCTISKTAIHLITQGELTGRLSQSLLTSRLLLEQGEELKKKILSSVTYPVAIGLFASLLTVGLVKGVMPQIIPMLLSLNVQLPLLTRVVIMFSQGFTKYWLYIILGLALCGSVSTLLYRRCILVRNGIHTILLKTPFIGSLLIKYEISLFLRSCGSLVETGVPVPQSLLRSAETMSLIPLKRMIVLKIPEVERGAPIHLMFKQKLIPRFISGLISAGESSGSLDQSLIRASMILNRDIDHVLKRATALIEPIMMVAMGLIIGSIALSIMMPIYDISKVLQK